AIGHINAHGTSTVQNDGIEGQALATVFGANSPPVTATKGVTGHMIGGSGSAEIVASLLAASRKIVPPVANFVEHDPGQSVDIVSGRPRVISSEFAISNSFAFGGHNVSIVLRGQPQ